MSVADRTIDPKILDSAKREFLLKGYMDASLREICQNAGVTTGALYKRFPGKAMLFEAVAAPALQAAEDLTADMEQYRRGCLERNRPQFIWDLSEENLRGITEYIYERREDFKLLLCCSEGTVYSGFLNDFADENTRLSLKLMEEGVKKGLLRRVMEQEELHILLSAYWSALFEPVIHDLPKEKALQQCGRLVKFFNWQSVFKIFLV